MCTGFSDNAMYYVCRACQCGESLVYGPTTTMEGFDPEFALMVPSPA